MPDGGATEAPRAAPDLPSDAPVHRRVAATLVFLSEAGVGGGVSPR